MARKFKVGDRVRVIDMTPGYGHEIGSEGIITESDGTLVGYKVCISSGDGCWHKASELEKITVPKAVETKPVVTNINVLMGMEMNIKEGDTIKVVRKVKPGEFGSNIIWNVYMDEIIGATGVVTRVRVNETYDGVDVEFAYSAWLLPYAAIEVVKRAPKKPKDITVKISEDYEAIVSTENIKVGCQTITFADFAKLVKAVATQKAK